jgi:hypothetical protein
MSDQPQGPGWWQASDGQWYPPDTAAWAAPPAPTAARAVTGRTAWSRFRAWPTWSQVLVWILAFPAPIGLLAASRTGRQRIGWWSLAVLAGLMWVSIALSPATKKDEPTKVSSAAAATSTTERRATTTSTSTPTTEAPTTTQAPTTTEAPTTTAPPPPPTTAIPVTVPPTTASSFASETASQKNARQKAADYLDYTSFSRKGLIDQLAYEGFTQQDAAYGVDALNVDWNGQAAKKAAEYLDYTSFSRTGLIDQLVYDGFTQAQAKYGVGTTGL